MFLRESTALFNINIYMHTNNNNGLNVTVIDLRCDIRCTSAHAHVCYRTASHFYTNCYRPNQKAAGVWQLYNRIATCWHQCAVIQEATPRLVIKNDCTVRA